MRKLRDTFNECYNCAVLTYMYMLVFALALLSQYLTGKVI